MNEFLFTDYVYICAAFEWNRIMTCLSVGSSIIYFLFLFQCIISFLVYFCRYLFPNVMKKTSGELIVLKVPSPRQI